LSVCSLATRQQQPTK